LKISDKFTDEQCKDLLIQDLKAANAGVNSCIKVPLTDYERAALISFTYNVGRGKLCGSTLAKKANAKQPFCAELSKWVYAGGKVRNGLVKRRAAERRLCEAN
jgi:lysozyme